MRSRVLALPFVALLLVCPCAAQFGSQIQYFSQVAAGAGFISDFSIHNPGTQAVTVRLEIRSSDGSLFHDSSVTVQAGGTQTVSIGAGLPDLKIGWAKLSTTTGEFAAVEFFQLRIGGQELPRVGVLSANSSSRLRIFAYVGGSTNTGIAAANPSGSSAATLTARLLTTAGTPLFTNSWTLAPRCHSARFLNEAPWFPGLQNFEGVVEIESTEPVILTMLRSDNSLLAAAPVMTPLASGIAVGGITRDYLADGAVATEKIANQAVTTEKLADQSVSQAKLKVTNQPSDGLVLTSTGSELMWKPPLNLPLLLSFSAQPPVGGVGLTIHNSSDSESAYGALAGMVGEPQPAPYRTGVYGGSDSGPGVYGSSSHGWGVAGATYDGYGVTGFSSGSGDAVRGRAWDVGAGVRGESSKGDGLVGVASAVGKSGVYAYTTMPHGGYAAYFNGYVTVTGYLEKAGGGFKIDHPLDPENRYLNHSFVESPDMKNIYDGLVTLDETGEAWVALPDWFEALNRDFRYQLTSVGAPAPYLHIADAISDRKFRIAGGQPGSTVSWQITGIRRDAWADAHRPVIEEPKKATERGTYLHPAEHGQPLIKDVDRVRHPQSWIEAPASPELVFPAKND